MLFATLDTTVRRIHTGPQKEFLLSDTVGFIHQLPTGLIKAFRSTLEEAREADLLLHVLDYSDEACRQQREVTEETLKELGITEVTDEKLMAVATAACAENDTLHNMPFEVTPETVCAAIKAADAYGKYFLGE